MKKEKHPFILEHQNDPCKASSVILIEIISFMYIYYDFFILNSGGIESIRDIILFLMSYIFISVLLFFVYGLLWLGILYLLVLLRIPDKFETKTLYYLSLLPVSIIVLLFSVVKLL